MIVVAVAMSSWSLVRLEYHALRSFRGAEFICTNFSNMPSEFHRMS